MSDTDKSLVEESEAAPLVIRNAHIQLLQSRLKQYVERENPEQYSAETIIKDINYLLGVSIDKRFSFANGFDDFKGYVEKALGE